MIKTSSKTPKIEVITGPERRRRWAPAEKSSMVYETYEPGMTVSSVARKHGISPAQLFNWRRSFEEGALAGVDSEEKVVPVSELKKLEERIKRLERLLGQKTEEVEVLMDMVRIGREKKLISRLPLPKKEDGE